MCSHIFTKVVFFFIMTLVVKLKKKEDLRVIKTKTNLYRGLIELMKDKSFEDIKVSDICAKSIINRSTFYDHFNDKYELLQSLIDDLREELQNKLKVIKETHSIKEYYVESIKLLLNHVSENLNIYSSVIKNNSNSIAHDMMIDSLLTSVTSYVKDNYINESNIPTERIVLFYVSGLVSICLEEMKNPNSFNPENIINSTEYLISNLSFFKPIGK